MSAWLKTSTIKRTGETEQILLKNSLKALKVAIFLRSIPWKFCLLFKRA